MPLPKTRVSIGFLDKDKNIAQTTVERRETGYQPTSEYYPTMRLVKCSSCGTIGAAEFKGGLNLKEGDRLMDGKPIPGTCLHCNKKVELVPLPAEDPRNDKLKLYYDMQRALHRMVMNGERLNAAGVLWPLARIELYERWKRGEA